MKKKSYPPESTVIAIPYRKGGYTLGLYARAASIKTVVPFGYFFGRIYRNVPDESELSKLRARDAIIQTRFGDYDLVAGRWLVIGQIKDWNRENWPFPDFMIRADLPGSPPYEQLVKYSEDNPTQEIYREKFPRGSLHLPSAGMAGSGYVEDWIFDIIEGRKPIINTEYGPLH